MIVDVDSPYGAAVLRAGTARWTANDVPGGYVYGGAVRFGGSPSNPCTLTVKNYESLKRHGGRKVLLDLSDPYLTVSGTNNVNAVTPPDLAEIGRLKWSAIDRRLYWQPDKGMMLIFR